MSEGHSCAKEVGITGWEITHQMVHNSSANAVVCWFEVLMLCVLFLEGSTLFSRESCSNGQLVLTSHSLWQAAGLMCQRH